MDTSAEPARAPPKQTHWLLLVLFVLFVWAAGVVAAGFYFAERPVTIATDNRLYKLFEGKEYTKLVQQLDKNGRAIVVGNRRDGLYPFLDSYLSRKVTEGFQIKKRLFEQGEDLKWQKFPWLGKGYHWLHGQFYSQEQLPTLWLIETRDIIDTANLKQLSVFADAHPNHRFIVAANETRSSGESSFKKLKFERPAESLMSKLLGEEKLGKVVIANIFSYHNSSYDFIGDLLNTGNVESVFSSYFEEEADNIKELLANSTKAAKLLKGLCKDGKFASKELADVLPWNGAVAYEAGSYYWTTLQHIYSYSNTNNVECKTKVKFVEAAPEPQPVPTPEPQPEPEAPAPAAEPAPEKKPEKKGGKKKAK